VAQPAPAHETGPDDFPINRDVLDNVSAFKGANGQLLFKRVVSRFAGTAPDLAASLREQFDTGNARNCAHRHSLKSSASALGANRLAHAPARSKCVRASKASSVQPLLAGWSRSLPPRSKAFP